nr:MAG TPA: Cytosine specific methyltransferase [Caudoviricetes sp.]
MSDGINVLSLFDGISCGKIALERAGIKVNKYFASEIDEDAIAISMKNYDDIIRLGDVTKWREWDLPKIDLIIAGSPCQGFSRAGKMLNFNDERSKLFFEFVDILNDIKAKNPDVLFMLENVKMKTEWRNTITNYVGVEPVEINSKLVSGQNRLRTYWTNIPGVKKPKDKGIKLVDVLEEPSGIRYVMHQGIEFDSALSTASVNLVNCVNGEVRVSQATKKGYIIAEDGDGVNLSFPTSKTRRGRVIKQKSSTLDRQCEVCVYHDNKIRRLTVRELERLQTLPYGYTNGFSSVAAKKVIGNGWTVDVIAHILSYLNNN